ncbi:MAG: site-specific integrase [Chloroflexi bacterium]|jgi:integrase|nr:site-specific integrase [Chloroflexota bacterium]MBT3670303.1 site-specific integrase [Chloroflexota bacterium]MBT4305491.1 site-specific integrase [Chloroflexota bacterium]MBT4533102.1 site-specific integrase [Chloroflexota bacterium]MBT4682116.1 site-specific integrase [Chloroflexota bacterium]
MYQLIENYKHLELERHRKDWQENDLISPTPSGSPTDQGKSHRYFKPLLEKVGLSNIRFHDLRHTAATLMLMNGIPLMVVLRWLGHSKPSITLDIYSHFLPVIQKEAAELMDELVIPIPSKWQQIGNSLENSPLNKPN